MTTPEISVVVTNRNEGRWIERSILSVLENSFKDFEVIVVDDGSDDGSQELILSLARIDPRIKPVILGRNVGTSSSRNIGIEASKGNYVALLDSDDCHLPHTLESMRQAYFEAKSCVQDIAILVADAFLINEKDRVRGRYMSREWQGMLCLDKKDGDPDGHGSAPALLGLTKVYKPSPRWCLTSTFFFERTNPVRFSEKFGVIDPPIFMARMEQQGRVIYVGAPLIRYRMKMNSITNLYGEAALRSMDAVALSKMRGRLHDPISPQEVQAPTRRRIAAWTHGRMAKSAWCNEHYTTAFWHYLKAFCANPGEAFRRAHNFFLSRF